MAVWQEREAKTPLSQRIEDANSNRPQMMTGSGSEKAVVLSTADSRALTARKQDFQLYLLGGPRVDSFKVERDRDIGREVSL
jgi:hypothetical protein